jgi:hypothetical protein
VERRFILPLATLVATNVRSYLNSTNLTNGPDPASSVNFKKHPKVKERKISISSSISTTYRLWHPWTIEVDNTGGVWILVFFNLALSICNNDIVASYMQLRHILAVQLTVYGVFSLCYQRLTALSHVYPTRCAPV